MCRPIISLDQITHQMLHDNPFSQRNQTTKKQAVQVKTLGEGEGRGCEVWAKFKNGRGEGGNIGVSSQIRRS